MNKLLIKAFIYILIASVLWSHFEDASLPNLMEMVLKYGAILATIVVIICFFRRQLYFRHITAPFQKAHLKDWLSIGNQWLFLLLCLVALRVSTVKVEYPEAYYHFLNQQHLLSALVLAICALVLSKRVDRLANAFILTLSCIFAYQLYLTQREPAPNEALHLQSPFDQEFCIMSGGYSVLNSVLQSTSHSSRAFGVHLRPSQSTYQDESDIGRPFPLAFGATILAPIDGTIIIANENIPDLPMGQMQPDTGPGNFILLKVDDDHYLIFANLQQYSIRPEVGAEVKAGEPIAAIGKSGMFTEPVLLIVATNTAEIFSPTAYSIPILFEGVKKVGAPEAEAPFFPTRNDHYQPIHLNR